MGSKTSKKYAERKTAEGKRDTEETVKKPERREGAFLIRRRAQWLTRSNDHTTHQAGQQDDPYF